MVGSRNTTRVHIGIVGKCEVNFSQENILITPTQSCIFVVDRIRRWSVLTKVHIWGDSLALRIPKAFALGAGLEDNSAVEISLVAGRIIVRPVAAPGWSLEELLAGVTSDNIHHKIDSGEAVGNEAR
jgi:antitoxin MazE